MLCSVVFCAEWKSRTCNIPCSSSSVPPPQTMQSDSCSVVTSEESSSQLATTSTARHVQDRSVQADSVDLGRPMCRPVSVADAAVEVGESLLASSSQRHSSDVAQSLFAISVATITASAVQSNALYAASTTDTADVQQRCLTEQLPDGENGLCCEQTEQPATVEQLFDHSTNSNHITQSSPVIVIAPDETASPGYRLSCDEHSSQEENAEMTGPLDNLAQLEASMPVSYTHLTLPTILRV